MKKPKKLKKPKLPKITKGPFKRAKPIEERVSDALSNVPRITNDTISDHREEVLSSARKYIYPLQHSKHSIVRISVILLIVVVIGFFAITSVGLYKLQDTSGFIYDVTSVIPFPVAKVGSSWVSYNSYLFELRHNMHYYETQQQADFSTKSGKLQLLRLKQQAMAQVIENARVKILASQHDVTVSDQAVDNEVVLVRSQNRLGSNDRVFKEVLNQFWGWDEADFKRELKQQMLQQAVVAKLDTATQAKAESALKQLKSGADFATLASQVSEDTSTKGNGGEYPDSITINDSDLPPAITEEIFSLKPGQVSGIINTGYTLDIVKVIDSNAGNVHAAHIQFNLASINVFLKPLEAKQSVHEYISS